MKKHDEAGGDSDADAFARAMAGEQVVPLRRGSADRVRPVAPVSLPPIAKPLPARKADEDGEEDADGSFAADGVDRRELRKLTRGEHPPASRLDLHGLKAAEACASVQRFVDASRRQHHRCICIVHGRGLRSPGGIAVLKARVRAHLKSHPAVLAYADAPRSDGGAGAVYVLLRRQG